MNIYRFEKNVEIIKLFMDRLWAILPAGWCPEYKENRKDDSIELWLRNHNDCTYAKHYLTNVSYRPPEEIMFHATTWAIRHIVERNAGEKKLQNSRSPITKVIFNDPATQRQSSNVTIKKDTTLRKVSLWP